MRPKSFGTRVAGALAVLALVGAGCGSAARPAATTVPPSTTVTQAFTALGDQPGLTATVSLDATAARLEQLGSSGGTTTVPGLVAQTIAGSSIVVELHTANGANLSAAGPSAVHVDLALHVGNQVPVDLRYLEKTLYARVLLPQLLADFGQTAQASKLEGALAKLDTTIPGLGALAQGTWVSADLSAVGSQLGGRSSTGSAPVADIGAAFASALEANATFVDDGATSKGHEYTVRVHVKGFVDQFLTAAEQDLGSVASAVGGSIGAQVAKIPSTLQVAGQVYVSGGKASEVDVDLAQFGDQSSRGSTQQAPLPLRVAFSSAAPITAPSGATALNLSGLLGSVLGSLGASSSSSGSSAG